MIRVGPDPVRYCIVFDRIVKSLPQRKFDFTQVYELLVGATKDQSGVELLVDDFRLEKDPGVCP